MTTDRATLSERDEIALAVGRVAVEAAWLEYSASLLAFTLIGTDRAESFVFGQGWAATYQGLRALLADCISLVADDAEGRTVDVPFYQATLDHLKVADRLMSTRGDVVHALWSLPNDVGAREAITHKRWRLPRSRTWTLDELRQLRHDLQYRMVAISGAVNRIAGPENRDDGTVAPTE